MLATSKGGAHCDLRHASDLKAPLCPTPQQVRLCDCSRMRAQGGTRERRWEATAAAHVQVVRVVFCYQIARRLVRPQREVVPGVQPPALLPRMLPLLPPHPAPSGGAVRHLTFDL